MPTLAALLDDARALQERIVEFRRKLHRQPEIGLDLPITRQAILDEIADLGLDITLSERTSAVIAKLTGGKPGPTVILRGDMDALPLKEDTGLPFASEFPGVMHACGHDTHVAMLAGAARLLAGRRDELAGNVVFFFQPGEEGDGGARIVLEEGLLDYPRDSVAGAFALHISTSEHTGVVSLRRGAQLAAADTFRVTVTGRGGHASSPAAANDPIPVACEMVTALQTVMTRRVKAFDPAILTVAHLVAGTTTNVIPATASIEGTIRTLSEDVRTAVHEHLRRVVAGVAAAHDMTAEVDIELGYPVTVNDDAFAERVHTVTTDLLGEHAKWMDQPIMGAEDFSYVLQAYPGAMAFIGACPPDQDTGSVPWNHSNLVVFDEAAFSSGIATHAAVTLDLIGS
ncbi:MAG: amidohydrolase [Streptosporangiales bacterium]|nr:amidohydrolase [Streptosporangiales bacterium]